jgi:hypothetical protein
MIKRKMERNKIAKEISKNDDIELLIFNAINEINSLIIKFNIENEKRDDQSTLVLRQYIYESCKDLKRRLCLFDLECKIALDFSEADYVADMTLKGIRVDWSKDFSDKNNIESTYIDVSWGFLNQF